jgi:hypothetical protein
MYVMPSGNPNIAKAGEKTRWKKGERPPNAGKPKGSKHINTWVQELMEDEEFTAQIREGYKIVEYKGAPVKAIVKAQIRKAVDGDTMAYKALVDSGWTKKTETDLTSGGESLAPLLVKFMGDNATSSTD